MLCCETNVTLIFWETYCKMIFMILVLLRPVSCYWDIGSTTPGIIRTDTGPRTCFFRWQRTESTGMMFWYPYFDWNDIEYRRRLNVVAGMSIDFIPLGVAMLLNRRVLVTSANYLDPHMNRQKQLRIWTLSRSGRHDTPYRYRVWRVHRLFPKSLNPEHQHGPRGEHSPRHDVSVIISLDQIYIYYMYYTGRFQYPYRTTLTSPRQQLTDKLWMGSSGFEYLQHVYENYKVFYAILYKKNVVDCSKYLPKWWGKFICIINHAGFTGVQNGAGLFTDNDILVALGCFEIRYNEDRIFVFTDLRYYVKWIHKFAHIYPGQYYEYSYPEWGISLGTFWDSIWNNPIVPFWQIMHDLYPLG